MKFNEENGVILLSCREFVATARRGISTSLPFDEEQACAFCIGSKKRELLTHRIEGEEYVLELRCHADEVKLSSVTLSFMGDINPQRVRRELREQVRGEAFIFSYVLALQNGYGSVTVNTVYTSEQSGESATYTEEVSLTRLEKFFDKCLCAVRIFARPEIDRVTKRLPTMRALRFPYKKVRDGQREFIETAYKNLARGGTLFATAPTGTGKTVSAIYPALRAMGDKKISKTFYLTPKGTTANAAKECLELFSERGAIVLGIILTAKEKLCPMGHVCKNSKSACKYCACNNLSAAVLSLYSKQICVVTDREILECAAEFSVCPYELSLAYSELCDVVICDFNYLFDTRVYIRRYFDEGGDFAFLIDEAHNLPDRAREMYSAEISEEAIILPSIDLVLGEHSRLKNLARDGGKRFYDTLFPYLKEDIRRDESENLVSCTHLSEIPAPLYSLFEELIGASESELYTEYGAIDEEKVARVKYIRDYLYSLKSFYSAMCRFSSSYELFLFYENERIRAKVFCIDTGADIAERLKKGRGAIFFSATLTPLYYYKSVLGNDTAASVLELPSPFDSSHLSVSIMDKISTRYSEREDTLLAICSSIAACVSARRGNYMIFSPSFEYSERLAKIFAAKYPKIKILSQRKNMSKKEKDAFLAEFNKDSDSYLIAFCVMGGIYSEGIDLAGDRLIGAVIVGIGMPSLSYEREAICAYYDERFEEGKQFAYIYPGVNRVLQAAGRVIRREDDRGVIVLIDDRFADPIYKKVIPTLWSDMRFIQTPKELNEAVKEFWKSTDGAGEN